MYSYVEHESSVHLYLRLLDGQTAPCRDPHGVVATTISQWPPSILMGFFDGVSNGIARVAAPIREGSPISYRPAITLK
jgi:hypothetical protein